MAAAAARSSSSSIRFKAMLLAVTRWTGIDRGKHGQDKSSLGKNYEDHVVKLAGTLVEHCGYQSAEVHLPKSSDMTQPNLDRFVKIFRNETLNKETIKKRIETFLEECKDEEAVRSLLLLCSHGFVENGQYFFCPEDGRADIENRSFEHETMLSYDEIESLARKCCWHNGLLIVDTCYAKALEGALRFPSPLEVSKAEVGCDSEQEWLQLQAKLLYAKDIENLRKTSMIFSCGSDEKSMNCIFIEALTSGLRGEAKLEPYQISATSVSDEVENVRVVTLGNLLEHIEKATGQDTNSRIKRFLKEKKDQKNGHKEERKLPKTQQPSLIDPIENSSTYVALHRIVELVELKRAKTKVLVAEEIDKPLPQLNAKYDRCWELLNSCDTLQDDVKQSFANLKCYGKRPTCVVVGQYSRGKSSLINALLDAYIRPTSTQAQGTLALVAVKSKEETDSDRDTVCTTLVYKNPVEWKETVREYATDQGVQEDEGALIKKLDGKIKTKDGTFSSLIESSRHTCSLPSKPLNVYKTQESSDGEDELFDKGREPTERSHPLLKRVEVTLPTNTCEILNDGLVLIDLPGTGSTELSLQKLAERAVSEADIVCVVDQVDLVRRSEDVAKVLKKCNDASKERTQERILVATKGDTVVKVKSAKEESQLLQHLEEEEKKRYDDITHGEQKEDKRTIQDEQQRLLIQARNRQLQRELEDKHKMNSREVFVVSSEDYLSHGRDDVILESHRPMTKSETGIDSLRQHIIGCSGEVRRRMHRKQMEMFRHRVRETQQEFLLLQGASIKWSAKAETCCQVLSKKIDDLNKTLRSLKLDFDGRHADERSAASTPLGLELQPIEIASWSQELMERENEVNRRVSQHKSAVRKAMIDFLGEFDKTSLLATAGNTHKHSEDFRNIFDAYDNSIKYLEVDEFFPSRSSYDDLGTLRQKHRLRLEEFLKDVENKSTRAGEEVTKPFQNVKLVKDNDELNEALEDFFGCVDEYLSRHYSQQLTST